MLPVRVFSSLFKDVAGLAKVRMQALGAAFGACGLPQAEISNRGKTGMLANIARRVRLCVFTRFEGAGVPCKGRGVLTFRAFNVEKFF